MNLEAIMKPYYDKKDNIEKQYIERKSFLTLRLENLRNNKEREIEEYVQNAVAERPDFYAGYGAMIRKDLEQAYAKKEQELEQEIKDNSKYYRLDVRELVSIKEDLRKKLISAKRELELQISEVDLQLKQFELKYARFEPVYDENYNMINGEERAKIFNENNRLIEVKYSLERQLQALKQNLNITEITKEEASILMMSLTPWEQEELNRRRAVSVVEKEEVPVESLIDVLEKYPHGAPIEEVSSEEKTENTPVVEEEPVVVPEEDRIEEDIVLVDSFKELLDVVFDDVLTSANRLRTIKLEGTNPVQLTTRDSNKEKAEYAGDLEEENISLPNGAYLNKRDIFKALDNYRKENKGRTFKVKGYSDTFEINRKTIRLVKKQLRECCAIKLVSEKKLGHFDIKRVYGKQTADKYVELGKVETKMASGEYINLNEFKYNLKDVFADKAPTWFEKFKNKLSRKQSLELSYEESDSMELDDEYVITK